jgi:hypothetical protein
VAWSDKLPSGPSLGKEEVLPPTTAPGAAKSSMDMKIMLGEADFLVIAVVRAGAVVAVVVIIADFAEDVFFAVRLVCKPVRSVTESTTGQQKFETQGQKTQRNVRK